MHSNQLTSHLPWLCFAQLIPAAFALLAGALLPACATYRPTSPAETAALASSVRAGDVITCETHVGQSKEFKVCAIKDGWLLGETSERVFLQDVKQIKVWRHALGDTVLHATGAVVSLGALGFATQGLSAAESAIPGQAWAGLSATPSPSADHPSQITPPIKIGETVTCEMRSGRTKTFRVNAIDQGWLIGESERVYIDDIKRVETQRPAKADGLLIGGLLIVSAVVLCNTPLALFAAVP